MIKSIKAILAQDKEKFKVPRKVQDLIPIKNIWPDGIFKVGNIFFDWDNKGSSGPQDGQADHVGIVQKVENGVVYTIEGNSGDSCRVNQYPVGHYEILGYGIAAY